MQAPQPPTPRRPWASAARLLAVGLCLTLGACDRPPARVVPGTSAATGGPAPAGPASGASAAAAGAVSALQPPFQGAVVLSGDLAQAGPPANLFVQVKPRGQGMPVLIKKFQLGDASLPAAAGGQRRIEFVLTVGDTMTQVPLESPLTGDLDIEAMFDPTGGLTDKAALIRDRRPLEAGPIELRLAR